MPTNIPQPLLGIFDSGVGGFSVVKEVRKVTNTNIMYYGDCARAPYGNREEKEIIDFIRDDIQFLQEKNVTHFINACNSMSVLTTDALLKECYINPDNYIDMIRAFAVHAPMSSHDKVLVIATVATIRSGVYQDVLEKKGAHVFTYAYEDLAGAVESHASREKLADIVTRAVVYAKECGATYIVYGCTHYPMVHELFLEAQEKISWKGTFIDPAVYVAEEVKGWNLSGEKTFLPYTSKDTPAFIRGVIQFL